MNIPNTPSGDDLPATNPAQLAEEELDDVEGHRMLSPEQAHARSLAAASERERRLTSGKMTEVGQADDLGS